MDANYQIALDRIRVAQNRQATTLDLSQLALTQVPEELLQLRQLTELYLNNNQIIHLPADIGKLTALRILDLSHNQIHALPKGIRQLHDLRVFNLANNKLNSLPKEIGLLSYIQHLNLKNNRLNALPRAIRQLHLLTELNLSHNSLTRLPKNIKQLKQLQKLWLQHNQIGGLPCEIGFLTDLTLLDLRHNCLISLPNEAKLLTQLKHLYLGGNQLGGLTTIVGHWKQLEILDLSDNQLLALPKEMAYLRQLQTNQQVDDWEKGLRLEGNRFKVPEEIWQREPADIIQYILDLQASENRKPLHEAKVLFVGSGFVGKTSLINMLLWGHYRPNQQITDGIDIQKWEIQRGRDTIRLHTWDFGGQEIMHATHKFFMTSRSVYVLVINPRTEDKYGDSELEYWLKLIHSYAGEVPVVIVVNKCDICKIDLPKGEVRDKYPNIVGFVETSCKQNVGIAKLKREIQKAVFQLDHIEDVLPESYFEIKRKLETHNADYLPYDSYTQLCLDINPKFTEQSMQTLVGLLHDLGVMLNFSEDRKLQDTQVLNPEWVTHGVYQIITSSQLIKKKGILTVRDIAGILDHNLYPSKKERFFIMDIMDRFELCYQVPDVRDTYFVPGAFPKDRPSIEWQIETEQLRFQYHYDVMPSSIMSRFIVKVHDFIRGKDYWRNGVVIHKNHCNAYIKADPQDCKIYINIIGQGSKRDVLGFIRGQFEVIHAKIPKISVASKIPVDQQGKIVVDYEDLLFYEEIGETSIPIRSLRKRVHIRSLLDGISPADERQQHRVRAEQLRDDQPQPQITEPIYTPLQPMYTPKTPSSMPIPLLWIPHHSAAWWHWVVFAIMIGVGLVGFLAGLAELTGVNLLDLWKMLVTDAK